MEAAQKLISTRRGTIILSVIAAAVAGGLILVYVNRYRDSVKAQGAPVTVLVARQMIPKGTAGNVIAEQDLYSATTLRQSQVLNGAFSDASSLRGEVAAQDIFPGAQLVASDFAAASTNLAASLTGTERIVSIPFSAANGLAGELQAGDHVDVYVGFNVVPIGANGVAQNGGQAKAVVRRVLTDIPVVAVAGKTSGVISAGGPGNISFMVNDQQAADFDFASQNGALWLALRPASGAKSTPPSIVSMETLLLGVPPREIVKDLGARRCPSPAPASSFSSSRASRAGRSARRCRRPLPSASPSSATRSPALGSFWRSRPPTSCSWAAQGIRNRPSASSATS